MSQKVRSSALDFNSEINETLYHRLAVGNVLMGESGEVEKLGEYCNVNAGNSNGQMIMSRIIRAYDGVTFYKSDMF